MKTFRTVIFASLRRTFFLIGSIVAGAAVSQSAGATIHSDAAYNDRVAVPAFVPDVRALVVDAAQTRGWKLVNEGPGELTFELQHARSHMDVVVTAFHSKSEVSFRKVSARTFQCDPLSPCEVKQDVVQRWMLSLRRDVGVALLRLAIQDAGGKLPTVPRAVAEAE